MFALDAEEAKDNAASLLREYAPAYKRFGRSAVMLSSDDVIDYFKENGHLLESQNEDRVYSILHKKDDFVLSLDDFILISKLTGLPLVCVFSRITCVSEEIATGFLLADQQANLINQQF